jgi:hypothetical protein
MTRQTATTNKQNWQPHRGKRALLCGAGAESFGACAKVSPRLLAVDPPVIGLDARLGAGERRRVRAW